MAGKTAISINNFHLFCDFLAAMFIRTQTSQSLLSQIRPGGAVIRW